MRCNWCASAATTCRMLFLPVWGPWLRLWACPMPWWRMFASARRMAKFVRRQESVRLLIDEGVNTFVEVGPSHVLTGLLRQIERSAGALNVEDEKSLAVTVEKIAAARSDAA